MPATIAPATFLKLNLGCGHRRTPGFINVDKFGDPDLRLDLESLPWPWPDNSVDEIELRHVLEHLAPLPTVYLGIFKEMYRVCRDGAAIHIQVPHPRHDCFLNDPTHVRAITPDGLALFSAKVNRKYIAENFGNSTLALYLQVDFELVKATAILDPVYQNKLHSQKMTLAQISELSHISNNVIAEYEMELVVHKQS